MEAKKLKKKKKKKILTIPIGFVSYKESKKTLCFIK